MADDDSLLLNISLADPDDSAQPGAQGESSSSHEADNNAARQGKHFQSEADFLRIKEGYHAKVENGEIWRNVKLPLGDNVTKPESQNLLHAVEELYFFGRYAEAISFMDRVLSSEENMAALDTDTVRLLRLYKAKCEKRIERPAEAASGHVGQDDSNQEAIKAQEDPKAEDSN